MAKGFSPPRCRRRAAATSNAASGCLILMAAFIVNLLGSDAATAFAASAAAAAGERSPPPLRMQRKERSEDLGPGLRGFPPLAPMGDGTHGSAAQTPRPLNSTRAARLFDEII